MLESILFPSASFVRSYESLIVRTKDSQTFNGVLKKDAPEVYSKIEALIEERAG